jgi:hypothetical protein
MQDYWTKEEWSEGVWRKLHNEEPRGLYSSPSIIRAIKFRGMGWTAYVARMEGKGKQAGY